MMKSAVCFCCVVMVKLDCLLAFESDCLVLAYFFAS